jgi:uncharacterized protein
MMTIKAFIARHPVPTYYGLVFAISWGAIVFVLGPAGIVSTKYNPLVLAQFVYVAALAGPCVAGILMTGFVDGRAGLRELLSRMCRWRVGGRWYAVALLTAPMVTTAILFTLSPISPEFLPTIVTTKDKAGLLLSGIVLGLVVCFFEELGWTGFAAPALRKRYGILATGLIMGLLWGAWHLPLFSGSASASGALPPALYLAVLQSQGPERTAHHRSAPQTASSLWTERSSLQRLEGKLAGRPLWNMGRIVLGGQESSIFDLPKAFAHVVSNQLQS